jgi:hypothetical protein
MNAYFGYFALTCILALGDVISFSLGISSGDVLSTRLSTDITFFIMVSIWHRLGLIK